MVGQAQVGRQRLSLPRLEAIACRDRGGQRRHNLLAGAVIDGAVTACARLVGQTGNALLQKTRNPFAHRFAVHALFLGDLADRLLLHKEPHNLIALA